MSKIRNITPLIAITDEKKVTAKVFRLLKRDRPNDGACKHDLWVRFDWTEQGWQMSFYGKRAETDAIKGHEPLTKLTVYQAELAVVAAQMLKELEDSGKTSTPDIEFPPEK